MAEVMDQEERRLRALGRDCLIDSAIYLLRLAEVTEWMVDRTPLGPGHPR